MAELKWRPRLKLYKYQARSSCTFDPVTLQAKSYGHWMFVSKIKGKLVFNNYRYSQTTGSHQRMVRSLLRDLKIKIDLEVNQYKSLDDGLDESLNRLYMRLFALELALGRKGARKALVKPRKQKIQALKDSIRTIKTFGARINKQNIRVAKAAAHNTETWRINRAKEIYASKALERQKVRFKSQIKDVLDTTKE